MWPSFLVSVQDFFGPAALRKSKSPASCIHSRAETAAGFIPAATHSGKPQKCGSNYNCSYFPTTMLSEEWKWHQVGFQSQKPHVTWSTKDLDNFMLFWLWCKRRYRQTSVRLAISFRKCVSYAVRCEVHDYFNNASHTWIYLCSKKNKTKSIYVFIKQGQNNNTVSILLSNTVKQG